MSIFTWHGAENRTTELTEAQLSDLRKRDEWTKWKRMGKVEVYKAIFDPASRRFSHLALLTIASTKEEAERNFEAVVQFRRRNIPIAGALLR